MTEVRTTRHGPIGAQAGSPWMAGLCLVLVLLGCGGERGGAVASDTALPVGDSAGTASDPVATVPVAAPAVDSLTPPAAVDAAPS